MCWKTNRTNNAQDNLPRINLVVKKEASVICFGNGTESKVSMCVILKDLNVSMLVAAVKLP